MSSEHGDWTLAALTPGIGPVAMLRLVQTFGSIGAALDANRQVLAPIVGAEAAHALKERVAAEAAQAALAWAQKPDAFLLTLLDDDYPTQLAEADTPPPLLFGRGRRELLARPMIAVVGSRNALAPACATARDFSASLARHGYTVVSGMASGIDSAAHQGALTEEASTIAVVGTGIDRVYPASNHALAQQLAQHGLILSEFPLGMKPHAHNFPRRNRIIAGLSKACLVVEASVESGSLITARLAAEAGREVMAIPGSIHNPQARGCHRLIKQGARLIETIDDILDEVGRLPGRPHPAPQRDVAPRDAVGLAMGHEAVTLDELGTKLGLTATELYAKLLQLELEGRVASLPGGRFQWIDV
jgi:DNA processing protein